MTPEGNRIICIKTNQVSDYSNLDPMMIAKISIAVLDGLLKAEPMHGNIFLYDLKYLTTSIFLAFSPILTKRLLTIWLVST